MCEVSFSVKYSCSHFLMIYLDCPMGSLQLMHFRSLSRWLSLWCLWGTCPFFHQGRLYCCSFWIFWRRFGWRLLWWGAAFTSVGCENEMGNWEMSILLPRPLFSGVFLGWLFGLKSSSSKILYIHFRFKDEDAFQRLKMFFLFFSPRTLGLLLLVVIV